MIHELREPIPVDTPLGKGFALMKESGWFDTYWTVVLVNGALVDFPQSKIRVQRNYTLGLNFNDDEMRSVVS